MMIGTGDCPPNEAAARIADRALETGIIDETQHQELASCFSTIPSPDDCGLDPVDAERFVTTTLQLIEICLCEQTPLRKGFVNPILAGELEKLRKIEGGTDWQLGTVNEVGRKGGDRRFTFGQVKENPDDPDDPSFFGGVWMANCDGAERRVVFAIAADAIPGSEDWVPVSNSGDHEKHLEELVRARGQRPWQLQVKPNSEMGLWIANLAGTSNIGQHSGHIPLGVLSEAVRRSLEPRGLTHLLLGPSRRDPPTRPWHTGSFLRRIGNSFDFEWRGYAIEERRNALVEARCTIGIRGKILGLLES
ncbi:MAG: hypothetical protein VYD70_05090 [Planctomycetota bacterium]|nr:hypothetical protein [Planctomycetota bacterium]MEE2883082.1 hypothetical protein [Planctomycetota bacterium]